jgi:hypothetical protein
MTIVSTVGDAGAPAPTGSVSGRFDKEAAWTVLKEKQIQRHKKPAIRMANVRRGHFIIGYLSRTFELRDSR